MTTQELVERLLAGAVDFEEFSQTAGNSLHRDMNLHRAKLARAAASRLSEMEGALRDIKGGYVPGMADLALAHDWHAVVNLFQARARAALEHDKGEPKP